ncbi:MAG: hypothetical protein WBC51_08785 [Vicinamibacterales bacterium]
MTPNRPLITSAWVGPVTRGLILHQEWYETWKLLVRNLEAFNEEFAIRARVVNVPKQGTIRSVENGLRYHAEFEREAESRTSTRLTRRLRV